MSSLLEVSTQRDYYQTLCNKWSINQASHKHFKMLSTNFLMKDYTSCFPVIRNLLTQSTHTAINQLKSVCVVCGIPKTVISDSSPNWHLRNSDFSICTSSAISHHCHGTLSEMDLCEESSRLSKPR